MTASPTDDLASAERRTQELNKELSQARGELSEARGELAEARKQQAATTDILKVISSSPTDLHGVMETIAHNAAHVCGANDAQVYRIDNGALRIVASYGAVGATARARTDGLPLTRGTVTGRAFLDRRSIHVPDLAAALETEFPEAASYQKELGFRTTLATPLLSKNVAMGVLTIRRMAVDPFSDKQIATLETFADQAVIAIENTRLFEAEQASKRDLQRSLDYQTATSEVLNVISRSPSQLQPVVDTIARNAARLCSALFCFVYRFDGKLIHFAASDGLDPEEDEAARRQYPLPPSRASAATRAILNATVEEIPDIEADPDYEHKAATFYRSIV